MLGVATLIVVMAVMNGFRTELLNKILGFSGHATIVANDRGPIADFENMRQRLAKIAGVVTVIPFVEGQALASSTVNNTGVLVRGVSEARPSADPRPQQRQAANRDPQPGRCPMAKPHLKVSTSPVA